MKTPKAKPEKKPSDNQVYDAMGDLEHALDDLKGLAEVLCDLAKTFEEPRAAGINYLSRRLRDHWEIIGNVHSLLFDALDMKALGAKRMAELARDAA